MYQSEQIGELAKALASAQQEFKPADKNSKNTVGGGVKREYADINAVYAAIRGILPKHDLSVAQTMRPSDQGTVCVRTMLMHSSGQWIAGECVLPWDRQGGPQGAGSAITYARRYSLSAILGVVSEADDDGDGAMPQKGKENKTQPNNKKDGMSFDFAAKEKVQRIQILMRELGINDREERIKKTNSWLVRSGYAEVASTNELLNGQAQRLISVLEKQVREIKTHSAGTDPFSQQPQ